MERREFLLAGAAVGAVAAGGVLVPLAFVMNDDDANASGASGAVLETFPRTRIGSLSALETGSPTFFDYPLEGQSNILVKLGRDAIGGVGPDHDVVALSNICTHMGCAIQDFVPDVSVLGPCSCHFTTFDLSKSGMVVMGQATQNLPQVALEVDGDDLYATGVYRLVYGHADTLGGTQVSIAKGVSS
jgi:arsenite oxidase small subunit